jgi:hypothetical protein
VNLLNRKVEIKIKNMVEPISPQTKDGMLVLLDKNLEVYYKEQLDNLGIGPFEERVVPLARLVLAETPKSHQTLQSLISTATQYVNPDKISSFWTNEVTQDTFEFQKLFDKLIQPNNTAIENFVFHINHKKLLEEELIDSKLIPQYIRQDIPYNAKEDEGGDDYRVCFASGTIDELSKFLAGYALISNAWTWGKTAYREINSPKFALSQSIAVASTGATKHHGEHDMLTMYSPEGNGEKVMQYISNQAVPVEIVKIPVTVLLPEQINQLRNEGLDLYRSGKFYIGNLNFDLNDEQQAADIYAHSKHQELVIKYVLLKFMDGNKS